MADSTTSPGRITDLYECLSRPRRRYVLRRLRRAGQPLALTDLARDVAVRESETSEADIENETVNGVRVSLYHHHVPKLADANLVRYDPDRDTVALVEFPEELDDDERSLAVG